MLFDGRMLLFSCVVVVIAGLDARNATLETQMRDALQTQLTLSAQKWHAGFQLAIVLDDARVEMAAGMADPVAGRAATARDTFLLGSATKPVTASAVLQLVDRGLFALDDYVAPMVDSFLLRANGTTLAGLLGAPAQHITVRHLAGMQSGLADYDSYDLREFTYSHPGATFSPIDALHAVAGLGSNATFICDPGTCSQYSSTNFIVLGLLLASFDPVANSTADWSRYDQRGVIRNARGAVAADYAHFSFAKEGACSHSVTTHGFTAIGTPQGRSMDVSALDCLNGWTCGNIATTSLDMANFMFDLLGPTARIVSNNSRTEMQKWHPFTVGWCSGMLYGLGLGPLPTTNETDTFITALVGHGGDTYGYASATGYNPQFNFSVTLASNNETLGTNLLNPHVSDALCQAFKVLLPVLYATGRYAHLPHINVTCQHIDPQMVDLAVRRKRIARDDSGE